ncbi:MAG TPA: glycosyltransferase 87 family protein [Candidatus Baltobacteraceae bacterium]
MRLALHRAAGDAHSRPWSHLDLTPVARWLALAGALTALALAFLVLRPAALPGPQTPMRDFESYYAAGATWSAHRDPYSRDIWIAERTIPGVVSSRDEVLPFVGPPFALPLWSAFARLDYVTAARAWGVVLGGCMLVIVLGALYLSSGPVRLIDAVAALLLAGSFGPLTSGLALGQAAVFSCAAIACAAAGLRARHPAFAWISGLLALIQPNVGTALFSCIDRPLRVFLFASIAAAAAALSAVALGSIPGLIGYLSLLHLHANAERFLAIQVTPDAVARGLGAPEPFALAIGLLTAAGVLVGSVLALRNRTSDEGARFALGCAALPLVLPFGHEHDLAPLFIACVIMLRRADGLALYCAVAGTLFTSVDWLALAQRPDELSQRTMLAVAAVLAIIALRGRTCSRAHFYLALAPIAVVIVGTFAAHAPLRTWPQAFPLMFHAPADLSIGGVWHLEQVRSGIAALNPRWAFLRLLSLGGCLLLWFACATACAAQRPRYRRSSCSRTAHSKSPG